MKKNQTNQRMEKEVIVMTSFGPELCKELVDSLLSFVEASDFKKRSIPIITPYLDLDLFISRIAEKRNETTYQTKAWLNSIEEYYPSAALNILLREIAIYLDLQYEDHISKSEEIYAISMNSGTIIRIPKGHIKSYKNFAAFRTLEDARIACRILRNKLRKMFK